MCYNNGNDIEKLEANKHRNIACPYKFVKWGSNGNNIMGKVNTNVALHIVNSK